MFQNRSKFYKFVKILYIIYCIIMLWLLFGRTRFEISGSYLETLKGNMNLVPFRTIDNYIGLLRRGRLVFHAIVNLLGNVLVFIPFGFFWPYLYKKLGSFLRYLLTFTGMIIIIEVTQLITLRGSCDIDDLILNIIGAVIGFVCYHFLGMIGSHNSMYRD